VRSTTGVGWSAFELCSRDSTQHTTVPAENPRLEGSFAIDHHPTERGDGWRIEL